MANHKSARKYVRSSQKRHQVNKRLKTSVKNCEKKLRTSLRAKNKEEAEKALQILFSLLDRIAKKGAFHKNKSNRKKSRLASQVHKLA